MKNLLILLMVSFIISCNNDKGVGQGENRKEEGGGGWSSRYRTKVVNDCVKESQNAPGAKEICECVAGKAEKKWPSESEADKASEEEAMEMARECMQGGGGNKNEFDENGGNGGDDFQGSQGAWTEKDKRRFYKDCMTQVDNNPEAQSYCECFAQKVAKKYKTPAAADRGSKAEGEAIGRECLGQNGGSDDNDDY